MIKKLLSLRAAAIAAAFALFATAVPLVAQNFNLPAGTSFTGMLTVQGRTPVLTGGSLVSGSTDAAGSFTASATSGALVFAFSGFANPPFCTVVDQSATPIAVYAVTAQQITFTTLTSAHLYQYQCNSRG